MMEHISTIIVGAIVFAVIAAVIVKLVKDRKSGSCCGGCSGCPGAAMCHGQSEPPAELNKKGDGS
jgi:hypothetical protein